MHSQKMLSFLMCIEHKNHAVFFFKYFVWLSFFFLVFFLQKFQQLEEMTKLACHLTVYHDIISSSSFLSLSHSLDFSCSWWFSIHFCGMISFSNENQRNNIVVCFERKTKWQQEKASQNWMKCHIFSCFHRFFSSSSSFLNVYMQRAVKSCCVCRSSIDFEWLSSMRLKHASVHQLTFFFLRCFLKSEHQSNYVIKTIYNFVYKIETVIFILYDFVNSSWLSWLNWFLWKNGTEFLTKISTILQHIRYGWHKCSNLEN